MSFKKRAKVLVDRLGQSLDEGVSPGWRLDPTARRTSWVSDKGRRFPDTDKLQAFADAARLDTHVAEVRLDDTTHVARRLSGADPHANGGATVTPELVAFIATKSTTGQFEFTGWAGAQDPSPFWSVSMWAGDATRRPEVRLSIVAGGPDEDEATLEKLRWLLESHTVQFRRRRRGEVTLVEPSTAPDVNRIKHDTEISRRAARTGGWWGFAGGVLGGVLGAIGTLLAKGS